MLSKEGTTIVAANISYITEEIQTFCFFFHTGSGILNLHIISIRENVQCYGSNPL
jgi:hypothetical protein